MGTTARKDGSTVRHYLGYVKVVDPPTAILSDQYNNSKDSFGVSEVETYGIRIENGFGLGYFHDRYESIPLDCHLVIRVANKEQLDRALDILKPILKEGLCVTVYPQ